MNEIFASARMAIDPHSVSLRDPPLPGSTRERKCAKPHGRRFLSPVEPGRGGSALSLSKGRDGVGVDCQASSHATPASPILLALLGTLTTWEERIRLRWKLAQMANANPHLVADIGLTRRQIEAEVAKPFWRA